MEEEGTVVYFKTSPNVSELKGDLHEDEELVYREEWDTGSYEAAGSSDDRLPTANVHDCDIGSAKSDAEPWQSGEIILRHFNNIWVAVKGLLYPTDQHGQIVKYRDKLLDCISNSPLLTEDDFQLVQFIVSNQTQYSTTEHSQCQSSDHHPSNRHTTFFWTTFLAGTILAISALFPILFIAVLSILTTAIGGVVLTRWWMRLVVEQRIDKSVEFVQTYLRDFETLLSLVTQTTRLIRETEIIIHGFSRPSQAVPISKLELKGSSDLQCPLLRKKLFDVCQNGVCSLRRLTQQLCTDFTTKEEFDNHDGYLAFRQLSILHQFMRDDCEGMKDQLPQEEKGDAPSFESLESLKDASNLLAVQNSEMLKRLAIVTSFAAENGQEKSSMLTAAVESISPLHSFISEASNRLRWSVDFHKNYLFGEPPTHKRVVTRREDTSPAINHPLESAVQEVHCMDLKTQVAMQRVRALGSWLSERHDKSEMGETFMSESIESLRQQLSTIEQGLHGIVDHIAVCYQSLDDMENKPNDGQATLDLTQTKEESTDYTEEEESTQATHGAEEECSDDEMIFEAYISPSDVVEYQNDLHLNDEDMKNQKETKENSIHMMKELNSVLAVRNVEKQRKKELRERRKQGGSHSPNDASVNSSQPPDEQKMPKILEITVAMNSSEEAGILKPTAMENQLAREDGIECPILPQESELSPKETKESIDHEPHKYELPFHPSSREQQLENSTLTSSAIAQAVAAIALRAGRANKEELFHDDQDSSCTSSEDEIDQT